MQRNSSQSLSSEASTMPEIQSLVNKLRKRKVEGSNQTALLTAELLRSVISQQKMFPPTEQAATPAASLIEAVTSVGLQLLAANPIELAVGNIVRRVLHIIREEDISLGTGNEVTENACKGLQFSSSLLDLLTACHHRHPPSRLRDCSEFEGQDDKDSRSWKFKRNVMVAVKNLIEDIKTCHEQISEQAVELIHQDEVILTIGHSRTVMEFLSAARDKKRSFRVFVAEGAPSYKGQILGKKLAAIGLQTTVITDSAVFAMHSRVNMVIVGADAVMANGGVMGAVGLHMVALAAHKHAVPFVVVAASYKICPLHPNNPDVAVNVLRSPDDVLSFDEFSECLNLSNINNGFPQLHVVNPVADYVPPDLVSLFITEAGSHSPSSVYQLIADLYSSEDLVLQPKPS